MAVTEHPAIGPPPPGARPFWSVMIPTYEPEPTFLAAALAALLDQDPGPAAMQIELVDDGSTRVDPRDCVPAAARQRVGWFRQPRHLGIGGNWNACVQRARGEWVHLLHQDDLLRPGFYARLGAGIATAPPVGAAFCRDLVVDRDGATLAVQRRLRETPGILADWLEHLFVGLHLRASALVVRRRTYETLGGFRLDLAYALDWDMWKRIAAAYPLWYEPEPLACYRRHRGSASIDFQRSGENLAEIARSIELSAAVLPAAIAGDTTRRARRTYTRYAATLAWRAFAERDLRTGLAQLRGAHRLGSPVTVAGDLARCALRAWRERRAP